MDGRATAQSLSLRLCFCSLCCCPSVFLRPCFSLAPWYQPSLRPHTPLLCLASQCFSSSPCIATWAPARPSHPRSNNINKRGWAMTAVGSFRVCPLLPPRAALWAGLHADKNLMRAEKNQNKMSVLLTYRVMFIICHMALLHVCSSPKRVQRFLFLFVAFFFNKARSIFTTVRMPLCRHTLPLTAAAKNSELSLPSKIFKWASVSQLNADVDQHNTCFRPLKSNFELLM